jgi:ribosomal protein S18 acetylase RimI-like enzyme
MSSSEINITVSLEASDIDQILELQDKNHYTKIDADTAKDQGFVYVRHTKDILLNMSKPYGHVVAKLNDKVVGYALVMLKSYGNMVPELLSMFDLIDNLNYHSKLISKYNYVVMGQICIDESARGLGIFDALYKKMASYLKEDFDIIVTEIADRNTRSLRAHQRVGFEDIYQYYEASTGETWHVVVLKTG